VIKWPVNLRTFFTFFKRFFQNRKKRDFLRFFEWLTTFSRTLPAGRSRAMLLDDMRHVTN